MGQMIHFREAFHLPYFPEAINKDMNRLTFQKEERVKFWGTPGCNFLLNVYCRVVQASEVQRVIAVTMV